MSEAQSSRSRRALLGTAAGVAAAGVTAALTGCQVYGADGAAPPAAGGPAGGGAPPAGAAPLAKVADIPVGGGKIFEAEGVVVTQPVAGTIKAFNAACTHQGCTVSGISDGTINCSCHGSRFRVADGSVDNGPAARPLAPVKVTVDGTDIKLA